MNFYRELAINNHILGDQTDARPGLHLKLTIGNLPITHSQQVTGLWIVNHHGYCMTEAPMGVQMYPRMEDSHRTQSGRRGNVGLCCTAPQHTNIQVMCTYAT